MRHVLCTAAVLLGATATATAGAEPSEQGLEFFESKIRPVLAQRCYECHSAKAAAEGQLQGGLQLDTRAGIRKGGSRGAAVVPGRPQQSLLVSAVKHESLEMPPDGKLADSTVQDFVNWIRMGAFDPRDGETITAREEIDIDAGRRHWAFQPLKNVTLPAVIDEWGTTPVDRFIRARQIDNAVRPNAVADARTLIRRVHYDLVGLPPSPEQVERFAVEAERDLQEAYQRLVERLLSSKHYGERWARHWLDLVRFAESNGYAFDKNRENAYYYRDFVIRALNRDLPYDVFVRLQIAGDLLAREAKMEYGSGLAQQVVGTFGDGTQITTDDAVAASGFLVAGPFTTQQTAKERERSRYVQLDDMLHTLGTSMLGLTIGCARCHSHKYDPVPQRDYYRLASCFSQVGFSDTGVNMQPQEYSRAKAKFDAAHKPLVEARSEFEKQELPRRFAAWWENRPEKPQRPTLEVWHTIGPFPAADFDQAFQKAFPPEAEVKLSETYGDGKLTWTTQPGWKDGQVHNTLKGDNSANYLYRVIDSPQAQTLSLSLGSDDGIKVWVNGHEVLANKVGRAAAADQEQVSAVLKKGRNQLLMKIVNGSGPSGFYFEADVGGPPEKVAKLLETSQNEWNAKQRKTVLNWYKTIDEQWLALNEAVQEHSKQEPQPDLTQIFAAQDRGTTYRFGKDTYKVYFLNRGNVNQKQGEAEPGFLRVLMTSDGQSDAWLKTQTEKQRPARLALANWLTDTDDGAGHLLARVIVNRLWHHHFGRGIVRTPSDFGTRGERPSHPKLLDWLAGELIAHNWRLKPIHRLIVTSSVYKQGVEETASGAAKDPENLLLWRREPRRLEAEVIRDALLTVSGELDDRMYGAGTLDERSSRRSVYLTVKRSRLIPFLQLFGSPGTMKGIGDRKESTVAPQALAMMNSEFVRNSATKFARRVREPHPNSLTKAVNQAYRLALSRPPSDEERSQMLAFIREQTEGRGGGGKAEELALRDFCHILLCMNEFVYVD